LLTTHCIREVKSTENLVYLTSGVDSSEDAKYESHVFERVKWIYTIYKDDLSHEEYSVVPLN